jgi:hypothetical protein
LRRCRSFRRCSPGGLVVLGVIAERYLASSSLSPYLYLALLGGVAAFFASARLLQLGPAGP